MEINFTILNLSFPRLTLNKRILQVWCLLISLRPTVKHAVLLKKVYLLTKHFKFAEIIVFIYYKIVDFL